MDNKVSATVNLERSILRNFFEKIAAMYPLDNTISDLQIIKDTQKQLKTALRGVDDRCTCIQRTYGPCEVCQSGSDDLPALRNFYRVIRTAKKHNLSAKILQEFIENSKKSIG